MRASLVFAILANVVFCAQIPLKQGVEEQNIMVDFIQPPDLYNNDVKAGTVTGNNEKNAECPNATILQNILGILKKVLPSNANNKPEMIKYALELVERYLNVAKSAHEIGLFKTNNRFDNNLNFKNTALTNRIGSLTQKEFLKMKVILQLELPDLNLNGLETNENIISEITDPYDGTPENELPRNITNELLNNRVTIQGIPTSYNLNSHLFSSKNTSQAVNDETTANDLERLIFNDDVDTVTNSKFNSNDDIMTFLQNYRPQKQPARYDYVKNNATPQSLLKLFQSTQTPGKIYVTHPNLEQYKAINTHEDIKKIMKEEMAHKNDFSDSFMGENPENVLIESKERGSNINSVLNMQLNNLKRDASNKYLVDNFNKLFLATKVPSINTNILKSNLLTNKVYPSKDTPSEESQQSLIAQAYPNVLATAMLNNNLHPKTETVFGQTTQAPNAQTYSGIQSMYGQNQQSLNAQEYANLLSASLLQSNLYPKTETMYKQTPQTRLTQTNPHTLTLNMLYNNVYPKTDAKSQRPLNAQKYSQMLNSNWLQNNLNLRTKTNYAPSLQSLKSQAYQNAFASNMLNNNLYQLSSNALRYPYIPSSSSSKYYLLPNINTMYRHNHQSSYATLPGNYANELYYKQSSQANNIGQNQVQNSGYTYTNHDSYPTYVNEMSNVKLTDKKNQENHGINLSDSLRLQGKENVVNLKALSGDNTVLEVTYMLRKPRELSYQPAYYIKYRIPYNQFIYNAQNLLLQKPHLRNDPSRLYQELLANTNFTDTSSQSLGLNQQEVLKMVSVNGTLVDAKILHGTPTLIENQIKIIQKLNSKLDPTKVVTLNNAAIQELQYLSATKMNDTETVQIGKSGARRTNITKKPADNSKILSQLSHNSFESSQQSKSSIKNTTQDNKILQSKPTSVVPQ